MKTNVKMKSSSDCRLSIGPYPQFSYDSTGGGGPGELSIGEDKEGTAKITFLPENFIVPSLNFKTTKILGIPFPPGLEININTKKLEGYLNKNTGEVSLEFEASFKFHIKDLYSAPDLIIKTNLTTEIVTQRGKEVRGVRLDKESNVKLVGKSLVPITNDYLLNKFLMLPSEALAILNCQITID